MIRLPRAHAAASLFAILTLPGVANPAPGHVLRGPPSALGLPSTDDTTLAALRRELESGHPIEALQVTEGLLETLPRGRTRDAVELAAGLLHREARRHNLASEAFTRVRKHGGPLASFGAWFEAEQDLRRGRPSVAARECEAYLKRWPDGVHRGSCLRLMALALASTGDQESARRAALRYDDEHAKGKISEQVELAIARHHLDEGRREDAVPILVALALEHDAPLTGRRAEAWLDSVRASLPDTAEALTTRARTLRDAGRITEARDAFAALTEAAADDAYLKRFLRTEAERFGWRTRSWALLDDWYGAKGHDEPRAAWAHYRVLQRAGRPSEAADLGLEMQRRHGAEARWGRSHEELGRTLLLAGRYDEAQQQFDVVSRRKGGTGRRGRFLAAFATLMDGRHDAAIERLDAIVDDGRAWLVEARYWRSRALQVVGRDTEAERDRAWILEHHPTKWYGVLLRGGPESSPLAHTGRWGLPRAVAADPIRSTARALGPISGGAVAVESRGAVEAIARLSWPFQVAHVRAKGPVPRRTDPFPLATPPQSYAAAGFWDPDEGQQALSAFVRRYGRTWPELRAIEDLARVGLYDLSGPLMAAWYERWRRDWRRNRHHARRVKGMGREDWRALFLATHDHHHASRWCRDVRLDEDPALRKLAWPIAHGRAIWRASEAHNVDPLLVLGLVRQESTYDATAVSRAGARGALQIMPRTGHRIADLLDDASFTAADLEEPEVAIAYGIRYLGLLLERFDGVFPLAVAAYNAGPFNVSSWLAGTGPHLPLDAFVEHIPFRETRDYVKRVAANYDTYTRLYGPEGSAVVVPANALGDHPEVVDF